MQPFCSITAGWLGGSNVRSPKPSDTNTMTFCKSPFASAIISWFIAGEACCLAQLGSADMLMAFAAGTGPWNFTVPFNDVDLLATFTGPAAFAARLLRKRAVTTNATKKRTFLTFMTPAYCPPLAGRACAENSRELVFPGEINLRTIRWLDVIAWSRCG